MNATPKRKIMMAEASEQAALCSSDLLYALEQAFQKRAETLGANAQTVTNLEMKVAMLTAALSLSNCATAINDLRLEADNDKSYAMTGAPPTMSDCQKPLLGAPGIGISDLLEQLGPLKPFQQHVWVRPDVGTVEIALEDVSCYHEWIKGEGADISVWRAMDDNRVVGATLPLRNWKGSMPVDVSCSNI